jgi:gamma-glutamylcyclotransferase (GGCT)/AIG2-like uncharacterized protein YtfP
MKYFAYGSNMDPERMRERGVKFSIREHAILEGWRLEFNKMASRNPYEGYANIMRDKRCVVEGIIYEIPSSDIAKLDCCEGYPFHYDKIKVRVKLDSGQEVEAVTYIAQPDKIRSGLKPSKEYLNHLLKGCNILPEEYCARLRERETLRKGNLDMVT